MKILVLAILATGLAGCQLANDFFVPGNRDLRNEEYTYAVLRSERFLEKYTKPKKRREMAMINLGRAYVELRTYSDARRVFEQYLAEFPNGRFAGVAQDSLGRIGQVAQDRKDAQAQSVAEALKTVEALQSKVNAESKTPELLVALGNAYWKLGQYKSAGETYLEAITLKPELRSDPLLMERLIFDINGNLIPIESPAQRVALEREREPLVVENVHNYTSRGSSDFYSARSRFYVVTGSVRNRSTRPILGVKLQVTLYDSLQQILEVGTSNVGTLYPQQSRPFVVKSGLDAEAMNNISRYECQAIYQQ